MKEPPLGTHVRYSHTAAVSRTVRLTTPSMLTREPYSLRMSGCGARPRVAFRPNEATERRGIAGRAAAIRGHRQGHDASRRDDASPPDDPPEVRSRFQGLRVIVI